MAGADLYWAHNGIPGLIAYGSVQAQKKAETGYGKAQNQLQGYLNQSLSEIGSGITEANRAIAPQTNASYAAVDAYLDALGISRPVAGSAVYTNGTTNPAMTSGGNPGLLETLRNSPGYQFAFEQGMNTVQNSAAAKGGLLSGRTMQELQKFGTGLADQTYNNFVANRAAAVSTLSPYAAKTADNLLSGGQARSSAIQNFGSQIGNMTFQHYNDLADIALARASGIASYYGGNQLMEIGHAAGQQYGSGYLAGLKG